MMQLCLLMFVLVLSSIFNVSAQNAIKVSIVEANTPEARAVVCDGDCSRLAHVFAKVRRGEAVTVGVIGGSITQGAAASKGNAYGSLVHGWWQSTFTNVAVTFVNAGIGATGSNYGALRAQRDLLSRKPDFVIVEYAVNDGNTRESAESLEGLLRQILKQPNHPAVILLFMMNKSGGNAQEWFAKVGAHYNLPMLSYRDALWPEIQAGKLKWEDISPDSVHPNDRGHAYAAGLVTSMLTRVLAGQPDAAKLPPIAEVPVPVFTDLYEFTELCEADSLKPVSNEGWVYDEKTHSWKSDKPGAAIEFEIEGRTISAAHFVIKGGMGRACVAVDGGTKKTLDGWFNQTWGGYRQTNIIGKDMAAGQHKVRFELLPDKSEGSTGNEFRILGLGAAGVTKK